MYSPPKSNVLDLPVDRLDSVCNQEIVGLAERLASPEAPVYRQWTWVCGLQDQVVWVVQECGLLLGVCTPQDEHDRSVLLVQDPDRCIGKMFPALSLMGTGSVSLNGQHGIEHEDSLVGPLLKISVIGDLTSQIIVKLLIYVDERWWYGDTWFHTETQTVCLPSQVDVLNEKLGVTWDWSYGTRDADKTIKPVKVDAVGKMSADGNNGWTVIMPIRELEKIQKEKQAWEQKQNGGSSNGNRQKSKEYQRVMVKVDEMEHVQQVQQKIKDMGFRATSLTDELEAMKETTRMLRLVLGAIGAISMVVAAISITNTMVMAIYERTKEIGIMKVIGASLKDIKGLFLTEAAFIGFSGGIIGIIVSYGASFLVNFVAQRQGSTMQSAIPIWLALGGVAFSTAVGVIAGYLPAKRAMKLSALMAIKTE